MLRLIMTIGVGFALLVGVGAWFDPQGAREAIRRDLEGLADHGQALREDLAALAGQAAEGAGDVARDAVERAATGSARAPSPQPEAAPAAGPRTDKKRPPVIASRPSRAKGDGAGEARAAEPARQRDPVPDPVEEVALVERGEFREAPLPDGPDAQQADANRAEPAGLTQVPPDVAEQGLLIRRMLALYQRVQERR